MQEVIAPTQSYGTIKLELCKRTLGVGKRTGGYLRATVSNPKIINIGLLL